MSFHADCAKHATALGFVEVERAVLMRLLYLHAGDDLFQWCSRTVRFKLFQGPGTIHHRKSAASTAVDTPASESWNLAMPLIVSTAEAEGFAIGVSLLTYLVAKMAISEREPQDGSTTLDVDIPPDAYQQLVILTPRSIRVFYRQAEVQSLDRWLVAMPVILKRNPGETTIEQTRRNLYNDNFSMRGSSTNDVAWYMLPEDEVFVYVGDPGDLPDPVTGAPMSKVRRLLAERAREQINSATMSAVNLTNGTPPIPIENKDGNKKKKKQKQDDDDDEQLRLGTQVEGGGYDVDDKLDKARDGTAPVLVNAPWEYNESLDLQRRNLKRPRDDDDEPDKEDDWTMAGLNYDKDNEDGGVLGRLHTVNRMLELAPGRTIGTTPLPVAPAYYVEQKMHRVYRTAATWGIPIGIMMNYSIFASGVEGKAGISAMGNKASGLGGATSSTKSNAWENWETTINSIADSLESWSLDVLRHMECENQRRTEPMRIQDHLEKANQKFEDDNEDEDAFQQRVSMLAPEQEHIGAKLKKKREQKREEHRKKAVDSYQLEELPELVYKLQRRQPVPVLKELYVDNILTSEALVRHLSQQLHLDSSDFEPSGTIDKVRKARNEPEPKPAAAAKKKKKKK